MAEVKSGEQPSLLPKRNPDSDCADLTDASQLKKKQKIEGLADGKELAIDEQKNVLNGSDFNPEGGVAGEAMVEGDQGKDREEKETDGDVEGEVNENEHSNGKAVIDRKGKGIMIEEEEGDSDDEDGSDDDDSDDNSSNGMDDGSDQDSDSVDDPLAEVNIDNILPSRTRGRVLHPEAYIASDLAAGDDDDDSDDSDA